MDDTVVIALFRHGLTEANKRKAYLGWTDSPLCPIEKNNLVKISDHYEFLFSSDLGRCLNTAKLLFPDYEPEIRQEFREFHFGSWEGKTYNELLEDSLYQEWLADPLSVSPPKGETFDRFAQRIHKGWEMAINRTLEQEVKRVAIVTHGGVIRYLLSQFAPNQKDFWEWTVPHGKGYELIWHQDGLRRGERCTLLREVPLMANPNGLKNIIT